MVSALCGKWVSFISHGPCTDEVVMVVVVKGGEG